MEGDQKASAEPTAKVRLCFASARIWNPVFCSFLYHASNRHVRVHLYLGWKPGCDETEFVMRHSALVGDFPLDRSGHLSLARVKSKWALRGCAVGLSLRPYSEQRVDII